MNQDAQVLAVLRESHLGAHVVTVSTEQSADVTWVKFRSRSGYDTVSASWDLESTVESVASELLEKMQTVVEAA